MPTAIFGHARSYLADRADRFPHLVITPIDEPRAEIMEASMCFHGSWIAGAIDGMMHWRFESAEDATAFEEKYGRY